MGYLLAGWWLAPGLAPYLLAQDVISPDVWRSLGPMTQTFASMVAAGLLLATALRYIDGRTAIMMKDLKGEVADLEKRVYLLEQDKKEAASELIDAIMLFPEPESVTKMKAALKLLH